MLDFICGKAQLSEFALRDERYQGVKAFAVPLVVIAENKHLTKSNQG